MISAVAIAAAAVMLAASATAARPDVLIVIDKTTQQLRAIADGDLAHVFTASTGTHRYNTPIGNYGVERLHRYWYSRKYYNAPMPYSIFFHRGYAIHGTTEISRLGGPASHGCVRLHPKDAAVLFALVKAQGKDETRVIVTGENPPPPVLTAARKRSRAYARRRARSQPYTVERDRAHIVRVNPFFPFFRPF
jgi:lipoprotein-anchoring transpeptidase ErfK/SrfK